MILVVGASGRLGSRVVRTLAERGIPVRAASRDLSRIEPLRQGGAEIVAADLRRPESLQKALVGIDRVVAAAHAFNNVGDNTPATVDDAGHRSLIEAARVAGVRHFVFTSAYGAAHDHPVDFFRIKARTEQRLLASGLSYTILRPTAFMEFWAALVGDPIVERGRATIFGRGKNPINFVSVDDVARFVLIGLENAAARGQTIDVGGPENLTLVQVAETFERVLGRTARKRHVPLTIMRAMARLARPFNPFLSRQIAAGVQMDTTDQTLDMTATLQRFPMTLRRLEDVVRSGCAAAVLRTE